MKVALIHDSLVEFGGSERILRILLQVYPDAHVYTAFAAKKFLTQHFPRLPADRLHTSWIQPLPFTNHTSLVQALAPAIWSRFDLSGYDVVISHAHHLMCNLVDAHTAVHISYIPSPPKNIAGLAPATPLQAVIPYHRYIRPRYRQALASTPYVLTNSRHMQKILHAMYNVSATVIYPPVDVPKRHRAPRGGRWYLMVTRMEPDKSIEIAIRAANILRIPLKIAGISNTPPYERYLRSIAGPTVEFLGFQPDAEISKLFAHSIAFLFPSKNEDFGIAPLEAAAHGVPVIAYYGGGAKETIIEGKTGLFFRHHTPESLADGVLRLKRKKFIPDVLIKHAIPFNENRFRKEFSSYVASALRNGYRPKKR